MKIALRSGIRQGLWPACLSAVLWITAWVAVNAAPASIAMPAGKPAAVGNPDAACARCHRDIYAGYEETPMRRGSGHAAEGLIPGGFFHAPSGIQYTLSLRDGQAWLAYERPNAPPGRYLKGEQRLLYFIGSGTRGRTYLFDQQGWWFEAPVNWYGKKRVWDMPPNYLEARQMPFTLPVDPNCLHCHASGVSASLPGSRNHFAGPPFGAGGVTCEACHGDATDHVRTQGKAPVVNPAALAPSQRDSVCLQCHLEGVISVYKLGRSLAQFRPGQSLFEDVTYFVRKGEIGPGGRATSQWEALLASKCKQASGDRMTCTTCHDPHRSMARGLVSDAERVAFYRSKCLVCHSQPKFRSAHHPEQPDCASCHMPRRATEDIAHEQVTDHRIQIPRRGAEAPAASAASPELVPIQGETASTRDLGLAYAQRAQHGDRASGEAALKLLRKAEAADGAAPDPELHTELGFLDQMSGDARAAEGEYRQALRADPEDSTAAGDLAVLLAHGGDYRSAVPLWRKAFAEDPTHTAAGFDLAVGQCMLGDAAGASATLQRVLVFSPDDSRAHDLAAAIAGGRQRCGP
jgi:predicted CXXCH cytochrome family protein